MVLRCSHLEAACSLCHCVVQLSLLLIAILYHHHRFLVVENCQPDQHEEMDLVKDAKNRADVLFCLLTYIGYNPKVQASSPLL